MLMVRDDCKSFSHVHSYACSCCSVSVVHKECLLILLHGVVNYFELLADFLKSLPVTAM